MTEGGTAGKLNQFIYLRSNLLKNLAQGGGVDKEVKTTHIVPEWEFLWE
jgi:quinol-cytochrome oxidoreductase complex cytochrome b subunit